MALIVFYTLISEQTQPTPGLCGYFWSLYMAHGYLLRCFARPVHQVIRLTGDPKGFTAIFGCPWPMIVCCDASPDRSHGTAINMGHS
ncbi:unnamed protein product [Fusarium venenatum]|uniref:Uncharacterized protein n=1 Tax=Fusarium venenatum TaxID=56646 RepID=A0A2L2T1A5_9HYPO|nr:uncharacterized protein FVRRES_07605 [Fusarium venenatum]CEI63169.1 unnamed protein product [Fusarium venenatum]